MSQVCDVTALQEQLLSADSRVAQVQDSFTAPLSELQQAVTVSLPSSASRISALSDSGQQTPTDALFVYRLEGGKHRERSEAAAKGRGQDRNVVGVPRELPQPPKTKIPGRTSFSPPGVLLRTLF